MKKFFNSKQMAKLGILTALSFILYLINFPLSFMFPSFLKVDFGDYPVLVGGFSMGPIYGIIILAVRTLLKLPFSETVCVGELADFLVGSAFIIPSSFIYKKKHNKKYAIYGVICGCLTATLVAVFLNRFVTVPFYVKLFFKGDFDKVVKACSVVIPFINADNFYLYYLTLSVVPFNLLKTGVISAIAILSFNSISTFLNRGLNIEATENENGNNTSFVSQSVEKTISIAKEFAKTLKKGDVVLLYGEMGAGKTVFAKGVAEALGISELVTSPTYTYMNDYNGVLYHYDCYRLQSGEQAKTLGLTDYFYADGICLVEWAENIQSVLPPNSKIVKIKIINEDIRGIEF